MTEQLRKPAIFSVDDPRLVIAEREKKETAAVEATAVPEAPAELMLSTAAVPARRMRWGALFWSALSGLILLGVGVAVTGFIEGLFARTPWLGAIGLVLTVLAGSALLVLIVREAIGLARLATVEQLRRRAAAIIESDDRNQGRALVTDLLTLTRQIPQLARARTQLARHCDDIIDGRDLVRLAERELMAPLDAQARRLVVSASKRVSVVTAISPRVTVDVIFVLLNALSLIRGLAMLYGARPGTLGVLKLFRQVVSHLAVTGGVAVTDSVLQQVIGHGLAARLSARLGEGMVNGLLTARLGLLAIDLVRPLPFHDQPRPALNDLAGILLRPSTQEAAPEPAERPKPPTGR
jgi:putative membrane protein